MTLEEARQYYDWTGSWINRINALNANIDMHFEYSNYLEAQLQYYTILREEQNREKNLPS